MASDGTCRSFTCFPPLLPAPLASFVPIILRQHGLAVADDLVQKASRVMNSGEELGLLWGEKLSLTSDRNVTKLAVQRIRSRQLH
eukprot:3215393-Rhodomonas_salina.1